ncbi:hypothetical protein [Wolbachia endosymbiont (group A) of Rhinocyllus conicus]|uniref:hypothetical protein n=1 Tax=Wolbachia endosymbiont (group A) of Rhinocyllus conicus TaxID=2954053 RepID=UPI0022274BE3|nr:hypothetical protein [Wolbachia endosymbiont (group A) of Rhinocyllus conicus]
MKHASSLPEWQKNVVEFLSSRRKYRLFGWEFGPILLDELYGIRDYRTDYIRVGAFFTPIVAFSAGLVSFVSTRRVYLAAVVTSSLIVLGIITTLAVDYQMTKRKAGVVSQEDCVKLLKALERMPQYWWWPWSKQIEDITITEEQINRAGELQ